jgi:tetratricopeptide (TPR) repeat protein
VSGALENYGRSAEFTRKFLDVHKQHLGAQGNLALTYQSMGALYYELGDVPKAIEYAGKSIEGFQKIYNPLNVTSADHLALAHRFLGEVFAAGNRFDDSMRHAREALQIHQTLAAGGDPRMKNALAADYTTLGKAQLKKGDTAAALATLLNGFRALVPSSTVPEWQLNVVHTQRFVGEALQSGGDSTSALAHLGDGLTIARSLVARDPKNTQWKYTLGEQLRVTGVALHKTGDQPHAIEHLREALQIFTALNAQNPDVVTWRVGLAETRRDLGDALLKSGDSQQALAQYDRALDLKPLAKNDNVQVLQSLGEIYYSRGLAQEALGHEHINEARESYQLALTTLDRLHTAGLLDAQSMKTWRELVKKTSGKSG